MKKVTILIICLLTGLIIEIGGAQSNNTIELGIFNTPANSNTLEIRVRPTVDIPLNPNGVNYSAGVFTLRCSSIYGISAISVKDSPYNYQSSSHGSGISFVDNNAYFCFSMETPYNVKWDKDQEIVIAKLQFTANNPDATFDLVDINPFYSLLKNYQEVYGAEAQGAFYHTSTNTVLSVELLNFQANKKEATAILQWQSVKEKNLSFYAIERSTDGINFKTIGYEKPKAKNQDDTVTYNFIDEKPDLGLNYYRLKIVEQDNSSKYSKIVSVDFGEGVKGKSYPNPFTSELKVEIDLSQNTSGDVLIELFDMSGKQVFGRKVIATGRKLIYNVPIEDLVAGDYILRAKSGRNSWQQKINKQ